MEKINEFVADWDFALETAIFFELGQPALDHIQDCSCFGEKGQALEPIFVGVEHNVLEYFFKNVFFIDLAQSCLTFALH